MFGAIVLFTPGTFIATERGQRAVEKLNRGDRVVTRDHGLRRVSWVGRCNISYETLQGHNELRPVLVKKGSLGRGRPERDMLVSQQHRLWVSGRSALLSAHSLIDHQRIVPAPALGVSYIHFMCNADEVILANSAWAEAMHPDDAFGKHQTEGQRKEILSMYPQVATMGSAKRIKPVSRVKKMRSRFET